MEADSPAANARRPVAELSFDEALAELQRTVADLEAGGLSLEAMLDLHERGVALEERCSRLLSEAQLRIGRLEERSGRLRTVPLPTERTSEPEA